MTRFESGEKYGLIYLAYPRAGTVAGYVEIISVERKPEEEVIFKNTSIRGLLYSRGRNNNICRL